jgi:hypothetical protein
MSDRVDVGVMTITDRRHQLRMKRGKVLRIFSSFLVPLLLSILTVVIAIYQQKLANDSRLINIEAVKEQRLEDQIMAEKQRKVDQNTSAQQREEDREIRKKQRQLDREIDDLQRQADINFTLSQLKEEKELNEKLRLITEQETKKNLEYSENIKQEDILRKFFIYHFIFYDKHI